MSAGVGVSIVVPAYNVETFIHDAVIALLGQTIPVQVVVVDDASTDTTGELVRALAEREPRVTLVALPVNSGVAAARQAGVAAAQGDFIWFVDADDEWAIDGAERLLAAATGTGSDIVCAGARYVSADGRARPVPTLPAGAKLTGAQAFRAMLLGRVSGHLWNKLFAAHLFAGIEFTRSRVHSDQAMVAQLLAAARSVVGVDCVVYSYRLRSGSIIRSGTRRSESLDTVAAVVRHCAERLGPSAVPDHEFAYYTARFSLLSRMKDATSGAYSDQERTALIRRAREEMTPDVFLALARRRDAKRLAMLIAARTNLPSYRFVMNREGARR